MSERASLVVIDGITYDLSQASDQCLRIIEELKSLDEIVSEKNNLVALLHRARNGYIADLKAEVIKEKTGVDLSTLFDEE